MSKDGGPAFPRSVWIGDVDWMKARAFNNGMSLRDWFAGQAISAMLPTVTVKDWDDKDASIVAHVGGLAYEIADALIAERDKRASKSGSRSHDKVSATS